MAAGLVAGRRRRMFFDGRDRLAAYIASVSDIDDLIPQLVTYEIEWNKLHTLLESSHPYLPWSNAISERTRQVLSFPSMIWRAWPVCAGRAVGQPARHCRDAQRMAVHLLAGSANDYRKATRGWWNAVLENVADVNLCDRPMYFVSSNTTAWSNLLVGYARQRQEDLIAGLEQGDPENPAR